MLFSLLIDFAWKLQLLLFISVSKTQGFKLRDTIPSSTHDSPLAVRTAPPVAIPATQDSNVGVWTSETLSRMMTHLDRRGQYTFAFCPESWAGGTPKPCFECGNDTRMSGQCNDMLLSGDQSQCPFLGGCGTYCQCEPDGVDNTPGKVTSTAVVGGQTGTVIWEPLTLSEYTGLMASTTVTITDMVQTSTDSSSGMETFVAVIFAGGVTWWATGMTCPLYMEMKVVVILC